jgi:hypothetical protein
MVYLLKSDCVYRLRCRLGAFSPGVRMPHMLAATALFDPAHRGQPTRRSSQTRLRRAVVPESACGRQVRDPPLDFARNTDPAEGKSATCLRQADPQSAPRLRSGLHNIIDGAAFFSTQPGSGP